MPRRKRERPRALDDPRAAGADDRRLRRAHAGERRRSTIRPVAGLVEPIVALAPASWGRGHAVEALRALVDYAFGALDLRDLAGATDVPNDGVASHAHPGRVRRAARVSGPALPPPHVSARTRRRTTPRRTTESTSHADFRRAIERHDLDELIALFRDDAVLHSPITFQPFEGKDAIRRLLGIIFEVFEDFRYTDELDAADGMTKVLVFRTRVQGRDVEGIDMVRFDEAGMVRDLTVMVRPRSGHGDVARRGAARLMAAMQAARRGER